MTDFNATLYWEQRYTNSGDSGLGSSGRLAQFKADTINAYIKELGAETVADYGCGDGRIAAMIEAPMYLGMDVSEMAVRLAASRVGAPPERQFAVLGKMFTGWPADVTLSLDVIYHLVNDEAYHRHMDSLFRFARRAVIIYSSTPDAGWPDPPGHIRHRQFDTWVSAHCPEWTLRHFIPNPFPYPVGSRGDATNTSWSNFYIYEKHDAAD